MHEYSITSHPREKILFYIAAVSIFTAPFITQCVTKVGTSIFNSWVSVSIGASLVFAGLFWFWDRRAWRYALIAEKLGLPNLNGEWSCEGVSLSHTQAEKRSWQAKVTIEQTWTKILITLKTERSTSFSTSVIGGISQLKGSGFVLSYLYDNTPKATESDLRRHSGFCKLIFNSAVDEAEGEYFNGRDRGTYGYLTMKRIRARV